MYETVMKFLSGMALRDISTVTQPAEQQFLLICNINFADPLDSAARDGSTIPRYPLVMLQCTLSDMPLREIVRFTLSDILVREIVKCTISDMPVRDIDTPYFNPQIAYRSVS